MFRTAPGEERDLVEEWIHRPALRKLVEAFEGAWPETSDLGELTSELAEFSKVWDRRSGDSRLIFHDDENDDDQLANLVYTAAEELGMINPPPPTSSEYDYLLILGGLATGVEPRVKYASTLIKYGLRIRQQIAGLGSFRPLAEKELPIARKYAPEGKFEIDHLAAMLAAHFADNWEPPDLQIRDPAKVSSVWQMPSPKSDEADLATYAAASSDPQRRPANTKDTYDLFADLNIVEEGISFLLVTSAIYAPYQHMDAVTTFMPHAVHIETVGLRANSGPTHSPAAYLQEVRSALRSAARLELAK